MIRLALTLALALLAQPALAQSPSCKVPETVVAPPITIADGPTRNLPITNYVLALTWAPDFCATHTQLGGPGTALECGGHGAKFGFVLHGLWPNSDPDAHGATWPQWCSPQPPATLQVPADVTRAMLCTTPSAALIAHEWAKHGTCMAPRPEVYFTQSAAMFRKLHFPDMATLALRAHLTVGDLRRAFAQANPLYTPVSIGVTVSEAGSLQEIHLCLDRHLRAMPCAGPATPDSAALRIVSPGR